MCRNRTVGGSGTRLYSSLPLSNVAHNKCVCKLVTVHYNGGGLGASRHVPAPRYQCVVSAFPAFVVVVVFCCCCCCFCCCFLCLES